MKKYLKYLPLFLRIKFYKNSGIKDINNKPIFRGFYY